MAGSAVSFETVPPDAAAMAERVRVTLERHPWLVCERAGRVVGYAYAGPQRARPAYRWNAEVSAYVAADALRRGVGRALYGELLRILAGQGFHNAYAGITLPNPASVGLHEALGFCPVGVYRRVGFKRGAWHDVGWWHRELHPPTPDPPEPVPFPVWRARAGA